MIDVDQLAIRQGAFQLADVSLHVPKGQYALLMGKTGCGKTTILETIAGLRTIAAGRIRLNDVEVTYLSPAERNIGYVPQDGALFTTMTVRDNLAFALSLRKLSASTIQERVDQLADWLHLTHLLDRRAVGLSGGETQRIALGRAARDASAGALDGRALEFAGRRNRDPRSNCSRDCRKKRT